MLLAMTRLFAWAVIATTLFLGTCGTTSADLKQRLKSGVLRWGGDAEGGAPFQLRDPADPGRVIGFEVELADAIAESVGRKLGISLKAEFVQYEWVTLIPGLEKADFDVIIAGLEMTPERMRQILFSRPYYVYSQQLVVRKDDTRINGLEDCRDKSIGTLAGTAANDLPKREGFKNIVAFDGQIEPYLDLESGRLDAVLLDTPIVTFYADPNPALKRVGRAIGKGTYGVGLRDEDKELAAAIDTALGELMANGKLRDIYRRWHVWNPHQAELANGPERAEELKGLGFDAEGLPVDEASLPKVDEVDRNILAASAQAWTFDKYMPLLIHAAGMTVLLTVCSMAVAVAIGLLVCLARLYGPAPLQTVALAYVEFFRGVPQLLVLFFMYFGLNSYGLDMPAVATAILAFGLTYSAYESEVYRSAIQSVGTGQWEAGRALAMSEPVIFRRVVFPQALRTALGPMTNDFVALFKDTSLVSVIAVRELTKEYLVLSRSSLKFVELGIATAALYLLMSVPLGYLSRALERRWCPGR